MYKDYFDDALIEACNNGDVKAMKYFISRGADVNCKNNDMRRGNLGPAIDNCGQDYDKIKCLVENGAKVSRLCLLRSFNSITAKLTKFLVEKGNAKLKAEDISSAVSIDTSVNNIDVVKYILKTHKPCIPVFLTTRNISYWEDLDYSVKKYKWDNREEEYNQWRKDIIKLKENLVSKMGGFLKEMEI